MTEPQTQPKVEEYYRDQAEQLKQQALRRYTRGGGKLMFVADYTAIQSVLDKCGFALRDDPPVGGGYGHWVESQPADIDDLILGLRALPPKTRQALIELLGLPA